MWLCIVCTPPCLCFFTCKNGTLTLASDSCWENSVQQCLCMKGIIIICSLFSILFSFQYTMLCQNLGNFIRKICSWGLILHLYFIKVNTALSTVTFLELESGSPILYVDPTATESPEVSGLRAGGNLTVVTDRSSLCSSEQPIGFIFLHFSDIPGLKCFHLA